MFNACGELKAPQKAGAAALDVREVCVPAARVTFTHTDHFAVAH